MNLTHDMYCSSANLIEATSFHFPIYRVTTDRFDVAIEKTLKLAAFQISELIHYIQNGITGTVLVFNA